MTNTSPQGHRTQLNFLPRRPSMTIVLKVDSEGQENRESRVNNVTKLFTIRPIGNGLFSFSSILSSTFFGPLCFPNQFSIVILRIKNQTQPSCKRHSGGNLGKSKRQIGCICNLAMLRSNPKKEDLQLRARE